MKRVLKTMVRIMLVLLVVVLGTVSPLYACSTLDYLVVSGGEIGVGAPGALLKAPTAADFQVRLDSVLPPGTLGLPGEVVQWVITVTHEGSEAVHDVSITTTLHQGLRVDTVEAIRGVVSISEPVVVVSVGEFNPGEMMEFTINTTVLRSPANGRLFNQTVLTAVGSAGAIKTGTSAEMYVPTGLPATGYAPDEDLPGEGEPSAAAIGLMAFSTVAMAALFVWYRGRRCWF